MGFPEERENGTGGAPYGMGRPQGAPYGMGGNSQPPAGGAGNNFQPPPGGAGDNFQPASYNGAGDNFQPPSNGNFHPAQNGPGNVFQPQHNGPGNVFQPQHNGPGGAFQPQQNAPGGMGNAFQPQQNGPGFGETPGGPGEAPQETPPEKGRSSRRSRRRAADTPADADADLFTGGGGGGGADDPGKGQPSPQSKFGWSPYDEGPRSRAPLWFALAGLVMLGLLGGGLALMWNAGPTSTAEVAPAERTSAPLPSAPPGKYGFAAERETDPDPISVKELFGSKKKLTFSGRGYEMTINKLDKKCADAALGDDLQKSLMDGKCNQLVRASFRDKAGEVIGTVGVANLSTSKNATKVAKTGDTSNYVKPLPGKDSVTKQLGSGSGGAKIWTHGHYAILVWFQRKDGTKPDSKGSKRISQAIDDITKNTVFKALDNRSLTGSSL
ncbi:hypothetical protein [Nonomuraea jiangxiensis]|uniref:Uncharacterized protein n=1 Tax=Nonomuraea jiangxiensis TaxID=633440 RepID=A0A1G8G746_9ACTN|nr:hypothetical protein [Nonomuraea jiangxiensis]SDH90224.1 hypothetical protein SAMN05421869_103555 [Nonomuraea jiangxiensis]